MSIFDFEIYKIREMSFVKESVEIFNRSIVDFHVLNDVKTVIKNPYESGSLKALLYQKCWVDVVQWHLEDLIRERDRGAEEIVSLKRAIDRSNQRRTDLVEMIDDHFFARYSVVVPKSDARLNSETPAWAIDRLSILTIKIYHMKERLESATTVEEKQEVKDKYDVLLRQQEDLMTAIDQLLEDIESGRVLMRLYRQMKMYTIPESDIFC